MFLSKDAPFSQDLSADPLAFTTSYARRRKVEQVLVQANIAITETITVTLDSALGAAYDTILAKRGLVAEKSFVFRPQGELNLQSGDNILVQCTNANGVGSLAGAVKSSELQER